MIYGYFIELPPLPEGRDEHPRISATVNTIWLQSCDVYEESGEAFAYLASIGSENGGSEVELPPRGSASKGRKLLVRLLHRERGERDWSSSNAVLLYHGLRDESASDLVDSAEKLVKLVVDDGNENDYSDMMVYLQYLGESDATISPITDALPDGFPSPPEEIEPT